MPKLRSTRTRSTASAAPPITAIRRSGPCDFEYERTSTVRSGKRVPMLTIGETDSSPMPSSSTMSVVAGSSRPASSAERSGVTACPHGDCPRGW
ncbi:hypothetical protein WBK31_23055 [Nonomuraea sp. N2-4H]